MSAWERRHVGDGPPGARTDAERDHDRVLYASAFQRLAGITQVAPREAGAPFHNRLTHSLKVAQVGRSLAYYLKSINPDWPNPSVKIDELVPDCVQASALAHDLGHPPFGHVAEKELNKLARSWGGFEGNAQSFRILTKLALRDLTYKGLNLTRSTLNGTLKYPWLHHDSDPLKNRKWGAYKSELEDFEWVREDSLENARSLEAELMDWADDVTYAVHDLEDFYRVGMVPLERLTSDDLDFEAFLQSFFTDDKQTELKPKFVSDGLTPGRMKDALDFFFFDGFLSAEAYDGSTTLRVTTRERSSALIDRYISAVVIRTKRTPDALPIRIDLRYRAEVAVLKHLIWFYVIDRPSLGTLQFGQRRVIRTLHDIYRRAASDGDLSIFPTAQQEQLRQVPDDMRAVTDLVAGLTEEMAYELHHRLTGVSKGSILDAASISTL